MVEVNTLVANAAQGAQQTASTFTLVMLIILLGGIIGGIVFYFVYKSKFNIDVILVPFNDQPILTGLKARDYFVKGKDYRFKIWSAKRHKIKYNEESIEPSQITIHKTANGKIRRLIFMTQDSNGLLVPMKVRPENLTYVVKKIDEKTGENREETVKTAVLQAKYGDVDEAWSSVEQDKWSNIFKPRDSQLLWGFVILCVLVVLALGGFLWGVNKNAEVAETNMAIVQEQAKSSALVIEAICIATEKCLNSTNPSTGQPFNSIIVT